ncbi:MAG: anti-sigma factor family protein [Hylemonella sp.]
MMTDRPPSAHLPDLPELSAYLDGELDARARQRMASHLAACPACSTELQRLQALSASFKALPEEALGFDLAGVIEGRLSSAPRPSATRRRLGSPGWWPVAAGAALSITIGTFMGSALIPATAVTSPRLATMRVFDAMPPGNLCIGPASCYVKANTP